MRLGRSGSSASTVDRYPAGARGVDRAERRVLLARRDVFVVRRVDVVPLAPPPAVELGRVRGLRALGTDERTSRGSCAVLGDAESRTDRGRPALGSGRVHRNLGFLDDAEPSAAAAFAATGVVPQASRPVQSHADPRLSGGKRRRNGPHPPQSRMNVSVRPRENSQVSFQYRLWTSAQLSPKLQSGHGVGGRVSLESSPTQEIQREAPAGSSPRIAGGGPSLSASPTTGADRW